MAYRKEFIDGLTLIVSAVEEMVALGYSRPVLVGGAVVELYTASAIISGDFDFFTEDQQLFEGLLIQRGFVRPSGVNVLLRGVHHPVLDIGLEVVSGPVFDGAVPSERPALFEIDGKGSLSVISVEDIIADRMGQCASHEPSNQEMLDQAVSLFQIATDLDEDYLDKRISAETLDTYGLSFLTDRL
jgi:hypothetical protein